MAGDGGRSRPRTTCRSTTSGTWRLLASKPYQVLLVDGRSAASPVLAVDVFPGYGAAAGAAGRDLYAASPFEPRLDRGGRSAAGSGQVRRGRAVGRGRTRPRRCGQLARFVEAGGGLLVFGGENVTGRADGGAGRGRPDRRATSAALTSATDLPLRLATWDSKHPIFAAVQRSAARRPGPPVVLGLHANHTQRRTRQVLAKFRDGKPAVHRASPRQGLGRLVCFDAATAAGATGPAAGSICRWCISCSATRAAISPAAGCGSASGRHGGIAGGRRSPACVAKDGYSLVVNTSPREAETDRCTSEEFVNRFGLKLAEQAPPQCRSRQPRSKHLWAPS